MEHFRGKIVQGDKIFVREVTGSLEPQHDEAGKAASWHGHFTTPGAQDLAAALEVGGTYRLILDDGRSVEIVMGGFDSFGCSGPLR